MNPSRPELPRTILKEYVPESWFHPKGVYKVLKRYEDRLPNLAGCLFATFTIDPKPFEDCGEGPAEGYDITRDRIRRLFHRLRKGASWEGKRYRIINPYCTKTEFHQSGWPHYHVVWLTRSFVPSGLLAHLWRHGRVNVKRIQNDEFRYLLKYVCKGNSVPDWILQRKRLRVFCPSRGFLKPAAEKAGGGDSYKAPGPKLKRASKAIGERLEGWKRTGLIVGKYSRDGKKTARQIPLSDTFQNLFDRHVYAVALDGRYLGDGKINIKQRKDIHPWI